MGYSADVFMEQGGSKLIVGSSGSICWGTSSSNVAQTGCVRAGTHTVTKAEDDAGTLDIDTGLSDVTAHFVQILNSGVAATGDIVISESEGKLTIADGSNTKAVEDYVIHWIAVGT